VNFKDLFQNADCILHEDKLLWPRGIQGTHSTITNWINSEYNNKYGELVHTTLWVGNIAKDIISQFFSGKSCFKILSRFFFMLVLLLTSNTIQNNKKKEWQKFRPKW